MGINSHVSRICALWTWVLTTNLDSPQYDMSKAERDCRLKV